MPTSEANTAALKNANTALGTEEAKSSKASVYIIMTQDQCLDNVRQATSNSANDQVSDDLNDSKNSIVSNGVNNVQEFNVDVNSKRSVQSANVAVVQNCAVDADSPPAGKVLTTSEHSAPASSNFGVFTKKSDNLAINIDVNKSECANNTLLSDMTVITHQNSSENIRDIIASSDQINKVSSDSQLTVVGNNVNNRKNPVNGSSVNKSGAIKKKINSNKSKQNNKDDPDKLEDPVERLNKLRASISNALSEVKGVLKQYSTEQSLDGEDESIPSSQPADDGPVRFRFVRKIRRKSIFSEDGSNKVSQNNEHSKKINPELTHTENPIAVDGISKDADKNFIKISDDSKREDGKTSLIVFEQKGTDKVPDISKDNPTIFSKNNQDAKFEERGDCGEKSNHAILEIPTSLHVTAVTVPAPTDGIRLVIASNQSSVLNQNENSKTLKEIKQIETSTDVSSKQTQETPLNPGSTEPPNLSNTATVKTKTIKPKKLVKKDRRASIAAVEINQVLNDKLLPPLELKTQRRPSDSGTLVKQSPRIKVKTNEKIKSPSQRLVKTLSATKTEGPTVTGTIVDLNQPHNDDVKVVTSEELKKSSQKISNLPSTNHNEISATLANEPTVKVKNVNTIAEIVAQNQSNQSVEANVLQTEFKKETPVVNTDLQAVKKTEISTSVDVQSTQTPSDSGPFVKESAGIKERTNEKTTLPETDVPLVIATIVEPRQLSDSHKVDVKNVTTVESKEMVQNTSNLTTAIHDGISTNPSNESPVKVETGISVEATVAQNQAVKSNILQNANNQNESNKETSIPNIIENSARSVVKTVDLPVVEKTEVSSLVDVLLIQPLDVPKDEVVNKSDLVEQESIVEPMCFEGENTSSSTPEITPEVAADSPKKKRKAKRKVVIRRIKRKLSKEDTFIQTQEAPSELEVCEKEIEEKDLGEETEDEEEEIVPIQRKSCLKARQFEIGDVVMYAERYKKTQVKWRKATVIERITSISYKLNIEGEEKPAHISYIKKFTDRKVNFGGKEYLEIDYAQIEEDEEKERNYSIWNLV